MCQIWYFLRMGAERTVLPKKCQIWHVAAGAGGGGRGPARAPASAGRKWGPVPGPYRLSGFPGATWCGPSPAFRGTEAPWGLLRAVWGLGRPAVMGAGSGSQGEAGSGASPGWGWSRPPPHVDFRDNDPYPAQSGGVPGAHSLARRYRRTPGSIGALGGRASDPGLAAQPVSHTALADTSTPQTPPRRPTTTTTPETHPPHKPHRHHPDEPPNRPTPPPLSPTPEAPQTPPHHPLPHPDHQTYHI